MKKLITIFTPTFNRAYTLNKCYKSLKNQTCKDFEWLIVDDGSFDNTKELVNSWIEEEKSFKISYIYQENKGMHGSHNTAYENIKTELNICIDSDDYMPINAIEKIKMFWTKYGSNEVAGIIGLDAYENGEVIGDIFPKNLNKTTLFEINNIIKIKGDKKLVYRTEVIKKFPYPIFEEEKYVGLAYKYYKIDETFKLLTLNEVLCVVEYMEDGSSRNMFNQYIDNPKGFAFYRKQNMQNSKASLTFKFKECMHYVSSSMLSKNKSFIKESPCKLLTIIASPIGILLSLYILKNKKK